VTTFVERALRGEVEEIDDAIDAWHAAQSGVSLAQWLGFSEAEYASWVEDPSRLKEILDARRATDQGTP